MYDVQRYYCFSNSELVLLVYEFGTQTQIASWSCSCASSVWRLVLCPLHAKRRSQEHRDHLHRWVVFLPSNQRANDSRSTVTLFIAGFSLPSISPTSQRLQEHCDLLHSWVVFPLSWTSGWHQVAPNVGSTTSAEPGGTHQPEQHGCQSNTLPHGGQQPGGSPTHHYFWE